MRQDEIADWIYPPHLKFKKLDEIYETIVPKCY